MIFSTGFGKCAAAPFGEAGAASIALSVQLKPGEESGAKKSFSRSQTARRYPDSHKLHRSACNTILRIALSELNLRSHR
jgi:hypothetical protein